MMVLETQAKKEVQNALEVTARNAIKDMEIAISLSITKNGRYTGIIASQYLEKMNRYSQFCSANTKQDWINAIYNILCSQDKEKIEERVSVLECYEMAGTIMEKLSTLSLDSVASEYKKDNIDIGTREFVELLVLMYSNIGLEFLEKLEVPSEASGMKIAEKVPVKEVKSEPIIAFSDKCDSQNEHYAGISSAETAMDKFMQRLNNDEYTKNAEPCVGDGFDPTNEEEAARILGEFQSILDEIKELKLK